MPHRCMECGALLPDGKTCDAIFEEFLALEYTNPDYGHVHFLTVASFMIQHGRYSEEAHAKTLEILRAAVEQDLAGPQSRALARDSMNLSHRSWHVQRPPGSPPPRPSAWSMTIADVAHSLPDAERYCTAIRAWARATVDALPSDGA